MYMASLLDSYDCTDVVQIIDDDATIFKLCATGQYDEVNRLLTRGDASIVDVNSRGETLLHVSVILAVDHCPV
jgi:hypothetical protein